MKRIRFAVLSALALSLCLLMGACAGASSSQAPSSAAPPASSSQPLTPSVEAPQESTPQESAPQESTPEAVEGKTFGDDKVGYVTVPADWVKFLDIDGASALQCSDLLGQQIISLDVVAQPEGMTITAMQAAQSIWMSIEQKGAQNVEGATATLAGRTAYQVYGYYEDGTILIIWLLESEAGVTHYVAAEGPAPGILETVGYVESGYRLP